MSASISCQLHTPDPAVPYAESIGALSALRGEGKIWHIGVSNVTPEQLAVARTITDIATVQNRLNLANGDWHNMLIECESNVIGFIPYRPLRGWNDPIHQQVLTAAASRHSTNTNQIALAWLLAVSPVTLPIPGTATLAHLEDNLAAALAPTRTRRDTSDHRGGIETDVAGHSCSLGIGPGTPAATGPHSDPRRQSASDKTAVIDQQGGHPSG